MGPRNLLILFFSTVAVSLVILIIFFSLFFKNMDLSFDTRLPESAPDIGRLYKKEGSGPDSKADGIYRSTVNVPPELSQPTAEEKAAEEEKAKKAEAEEAKADEVPPVSDDTVLDTTDRPPMVRTAPAPNTPPVPSVAPTPAPSPEPVPPSATTDGSKYQVYMGGFSSQEAADAAAEKARAAGMSPLVKQSGNGYSVQLGTFSNKENADSLAGKTGASVRKTN